MIARSMKSEFDVVLQEQRLADVAGIFCERDFCDEVPLYSRYRQVDFLKQYGEVDLLLMELALDYLERVSSETDSGSNDRFAAITVIRDDPAAYIVPSIFLCNSEARRRLETLCLSPPSNALGEYVGALVKQAKPDGDYVVLEDLLAVPGVPREFVSFRSPPHGFLNVMTWQPSRTSSSSTGFKRSTS